MEKYRNYLLGILFLILIIFRFYKLPEGVFNWDVFGYYLYLPATFIYNDIKLLNHDWLNGIIIKYETTATLYQAYSVETGNWLIRYTMGNSILLLPFFFIAHLVVPLLNFPADIFTSYILNICQGKGQCSGTGWSKEQLCVTYPVFFYRRDKPLFCQILSYYILV